MATPAPSATASPDTVAINYSREVGWAGALIAELCREGPSTVLVTFNYDGQPEIGVWQDVITPRQFDDALALIRGSGFEQADGPAVVPPESKFVSIGERKAGEELPVTYGFELATLHPVVAALSASLERLIAPIRSRPLRVINAAAEWSKPAFTPAEPLEIAVVLGNSGRLPLEMGNPLDPAIDGWNGLRLVLRDRAGQEHVSDLTPANVRARPGAPAGPTVVLDPGAAVPFRIRKKVYLLPGTYRGRLSYQGMLADTLDPQLVTGELWLDLGPVEVRRERRGGR